MQRLSLSVSSATLSTLPTLRVHREAFLLRTEQALGPPDCPHCPYVRGEAQRPPPDDPDSGAHPKAAPACLRQLLRSRSPRDEADDGASRMPS